MRELFFDGVSDRQMLSDMMDPIQFHLHRENTIHIGNHILHNQFLVVLLMI
jgi:hypothetical protein